MKNLNILHNHLILNDDNDKQSAEPEREDDNMIIHSIKPYNSESKNTYFLKQFFTPEKQCQNRNRRPISLIDIDKQEFSIFYNDKCMIKYSYKDLINKYTVSTIVCVQQCAGNRRNLVEKTTRIPWICSAFNSKWSGININDLIKKIINKDLIELRKVRAQIKFNCLDKNMPSDKSTQSDLLPCDKIPDESLLAQQMNDNELTRDRGYPLRLILPGLQGHMFAKAVYKMEIIIPESYDHENKLFKQVLQNKKAQYQVNSNNEYYFPFQQPANSWFIPVKKIHDITEDNEDIPIEGIAQTSNGEKIVKMEISLDEGVSWINCQIDNRGYKQAWQQFIYIAKYENLKNCKVIYGRATDSKGDTQLKDQLTNVKDFNHCGCNAWSKLKLD